MDVPKCGLGWVLLLCSESPKRCEHCAVDGSPIVEEDPKDFLHEFLVGGGEWRGCVFLFSVFYFLAVFWFDVWVRLVLWAAGGSIGKNLSRRNCGPLIWRGKTHRCGRRGPYLWH